MKSKLNRFLHRATLTIFLCAVASVAFAQSAVITGTANTQPGATEIYVVQFPLGLNPYTDIQWNVTGGTVLNQNVNPSVSPVYCQIQWDNAPGAGYVSVYEDLGGQFGELNVFIGSIQISPLVQILNYGTAPSGICVNFPGGTVYSYQWEESADAVNWSPIAGEVNSCITPGTLYTSRYYRCQVLIPGGYYYSDIARVEIPALQPGTISGNLSSSFNTFTLISSTPANGGNCLAANYQYTWEKAYEGSSWVVIGNSEVFPGSGFILSGKTQIRRKVSCNGQVLYSNTLTFNPSYQTVDYENLNYVRENTILKRGITSWFEADLLAIGDKTQSTTYLDGIGRPIQSVDKAVSSSPDGTWKDIVKHYEYDALGRSVKDFIEYASSSVPGKFKVNAAAEQAAFIRSIYNEPATAPTWSAIENENSPLNVIKKSMLPGQSWGGNNQGASASYDFNYDYEKVHIWTLSYTSSAIPITTPTQVYPSGKLSKLVTTDLNGNMIITYTDFSGNIILKKVQEATGAPDLTAEHSGWVCTYYVYDDFGLLRYTITPKAVKYLDQNLNWNLTQNLVDELCFSYVYDAEGRPIQKKQPGAGEVSFVYDNKDRLVLSQDAVQKSRNQWVFNLFDEMDRVVATGLYINTAGREAMQSFVKSNIPGVVNVYPFVRAHYSVELVVENPVAGSTGTNTYCNGCNASTVTYNIIRHYDNYNFTGAHSFEATNTLAYSSDLNPSIEPTIATNRTTGFLTGEKIRIIDSDNNPYNDVFIFSTAYYDEQARQLQNISENTSGNTDFSTNQYDFSGHVVSSYQYHTYYDNYTITSKIEYDKIGRPTKLFKNFNNTFYKQISEYAYDELGHLKSKRLAPGYTATGKNEIEKMMYAYNINGSLTGINKDYALNTNNYAQWDNYFGLYLGYDNRDAFFSNSQLNGNIAGVIWKSQGDNSGRKFDFTYDRLDRLKSASFQQKKRPSDGWSSSEVDFSISMEYQDGNGNIKSMKQMGIVPGINNGVVIDDLRYSYKNIDGSAILTGNKLSKVDDVNSSLGSNNGLLGDFKDGSNTVDDYEYDVNGSLIRDLNKNIVNGTENGVVYNFLNKPEKITIQGKSTIEFTYDCTGSKLKKKITYSDNSTRTTTYIGGFVYEQYIPAWASWADDNLQYITHEEGRLKIITPHTKVNEIDYELNCGSHGVSMPSSKQGVFEYFVKDHLGNTRMVLTEEVQKEFYKASMESGLRPVEAPLFGSVDNSGQPSSNNEWVATQVNSSPWPGNATGVAKLSAVISAGKIGPNLILKVMAGDIISSDVQYFYYNNNPTGSNNPTSGVVTALVNGLSIPRTGALNHGSSVAISNNLNVTLPSTQFFTTQPNNGNINAPKAFLNIIFLDEQFKFVDKDIVNPGVGSDFARVNSAGVPSSLILQKKAPKNGWVFVYLSNESNETVYFDNLRVVQEHSRIADEAHYYPFGLKMAGISSSAFNKLKTRHGYQGEYSEEEPETGWSEFYLRMFDPQIGRWTASDPMDEFASPYTGMANDPINNVDPTGGKTDQWLYNTAADQYQWFDEVKNFDDYIDKGFYKLGYEYRFDKANGNFWHSFAGRMQYYTADGGIDPGVVLRGVTVDNIRTAGQALKKWEKEAGGVGDFFNGAKDRAIQIAKFWNWVDLNSISMEKMEYQLVLEAIVSGKPDASQELYDYDQKKGTNLFSKYLEVKNAIELNLPYSGPSTAYNIGGKAVDVAVLLLPLKLKAARTELSINKGVLENFTKHAFAGGRHADLGLSVETMATKGLNLIKQHMPLLKSGNNTLIGNINGLQKSFKAYVQDGKIISVNMYPGISNRATQGTVINFGNVIW